MNKEEWDRIEEVKNIEKENHKYIGRKKKKETHK